MNKYLKRIRRCGLLIIASLMALSAMGCDGDVLSIDGTETPVTLTSPTLEQKMRGIWIIGGAADTAATTIIRALDLYDPVTGLWYGDVAAGASGSFVPAVFSTAAYYNGKIYVIGGAVSSAATTYAVFAYDIAANAWTTQQNIKRTGADTALMGAAAYTYSNSIYIIGGTTTTITTGVQVYNLRYRPDDGPYGTWSNMADYATARTSMGAYCEGGVAYYFGGRTSAGAGSTTNTGYIIATNAYTAALTTITARGGMAYAAYEGFNGTYIFIVGGAASFAAATAYFGMIPTYVASANSFQVYVPQGTVTNAKFHPAFDGGTTTGIVFAGAATSPYNGSGIVDPTLYVFGGIKNRTLITNEVWSITANDTLSGYPTATWYSKASMPRARYGHCIVTADQ